jgi:DNA-binding transcriptional MerR regulator
MQGFTMKNREWGGELTIGKLALRTGLNVSAIRYYEEIGLIPPAVRRPSGHRLYSAEVQELLALVKRCRSFGFSIEETRALVSLSSSGDRECGEARDIAQLHLDTVRSRLAELQDLERSLAGFVQACTEQCLGGPAPKCTIFQQLGPGAAAVPRARCCG